VLVLRARPGGRAEVVEVFAELAVLREASAVPGFVQAELHRSLLDDDELLVTAEWEDEAAYERWLESAVRARMQPALQPVLAEEPVPRMYELVQRVP
jgi:quinol monooxygenase YgiN